MNKVVDLLRCETKEYILNSCLTGSDLTTAIKINATLGEPDIKLPGVINSESERWKYKGLFIELKDGVVVSHLVNYVEGGWPDIFKFDTPILENDSSFGLVESYYKQNDIHFTIGGVRLGRRPTAPVYKEIVRNNIVIRFDVHGKILVVTTRI